MSSPKKPLITVDVGGGLSLPGALGDQTGSNSVPLSHTWRHFTLRGVKYGKYPPLLGFSSAPEKRLYFHMSL